MINKPHQNGNRFHRRFFDLVVIDPTKLQWHLQRQEMSINRFCERSTIARSSFYRILDGTPVRRSTLNLIAECLKVEVDDLLLSTPVESVAERIDSAWEHPEWEVVPDSFSLLSPMSNGLVMRVAQVRHRVLPSELGRAKLYDIAGMRAAVRHECREALTRHAVVSRRLRDCPFVAENLTITALHQETHWLSVDRWFEGGQLSEALDFEMLSTTQARSILTQVASALSALHQQSIVLRELHPDRILVSPDKKSCVVTDLELSKLLEAEATVSNRWLPSLYRAPEIAGGVSQPQADFYSLGRLAVYLLTGDLPDYPDDRDALGRWGKQHPTWDIATQWLSQSLSPNWKKRPASLSEFLTFLPAGE